MLSNSIILPNSSQQLFFNKLEYFFREISTTADRIITEELIDIINNFGYANPSQKTLSNNRITDVTVCRRTKILENNKVFFIKRNHRHSHRYYLHPIFFNSEFRRKLSDIFPNLLIMPKLILLQAASLSNKVYDKFCQFEYVKTLRRRNIPYLRSLTNYLYNSKQKKEKVSLVEKLRQIYNFGDYEVNELSRFDARIVDLAYIRLKKHKGKVRDPFRYLLMTCKHLLNPRPYKDYKHSKVRLFTPLAPKRIVARKIVPEVVCEATVRKNQEDAAIVNDLLSKGFSFKEINNVLRQHQQISNTKEDKSRNDKEPTNEEERSTNCNVALNSTIGFDKLTTSLHGDNNMLNINFDIDSDFEEVLD
jgi:hypothetical protein